MVTSPEQIHIYESGYCTLGTVQTISCCMLSVRRKNIASTGLETNQGNSQIGWKMILISEKNQSIQDGKKKQNDSWKQTWSE